MSGIEITVKTVGFDIVVKKFRRAKRQIPGDVDRTQEKYAKYFIRALADNASGRPGPNKITGEYLDSWYVKKVRKGTGHTWIAATRAPQGKRLEYGFVGVDSLGRVYNQPPFPHVRLTVIDVEPKYIRACKSLPRNWFK